MCTLARLNKRLKHLLFHTLMQQEVHFFEENNPGGNNIQQLFCHHATRDAQRHSVAAIWNRNRSNKYHSVGG